MSYCMSKAALPSLRITLDALSALLDKAQDYAAAKQVDPAILLQTRLAPDMFPLLKQVQVATDLAKNGASRLAGTEPPSFADAETSIPELKARIARTLQHLETVDAAAIDASADRVLTFPLGPARKGQMRGDDYLNHFLLPNFYFHVTAAYTILRHCGVDIGKMDYLRGIPIEVSAR
jgi:hypothetical protein